VSLGAPVLQHLKREVLAPVELELIGKNRSGNFSIQRSCGSNRNLDSYHMSVPQLRQGGPGLRSYTLRTGRDRSVIETPLEEYACGIDIALPGRYLRAFSVAVVELCQTGEPYTRDLRDIIYSPDGKNVYRWDAERGAASEPVKSVFKNGLWTEGDMSHLWHTHCSQYRNAAELMGTAELVIRALHRAGIITEERMWQFLAAIDVAEPEPPAPEGDLVKGDALLVQRAINMISGKTVVVEDDVMGEQTRAALVALPAAVINRVNEAELKAEADAETRLKAAIIEAVQRA
jgi:hypothetical protein